MLRISDITLEQRLSGAILMLFYRFFNEDFPAGAGIARNFTSREDCNLPFYGFTIYL